MELPRPEAAGVGPDPAIERAALAAGASEATAAALARGAALYSRQLFWESHEAWEEAWLTEEGPLRELLQGLIQVAAGFHKVLVQRQPGGAVKLLGSGTERLVRLQPSCCGVELTEFCAGAARALAAARQWQAGLGPAPGLELVPEVRPVS